MQATTTNPMLGASLLAAAASMPANVMPHIVTAIASEGRLRLGLVGLIATAYMVGQFAMAFVLPIMGIAAHRADNRLE